MSTNIQQNCQLYNAYTTTSTPPRQLHSRLGVDSEERRSFDLSAIRIIILYVLAVRPSAGRSGEVVNFCLSTWLTYTQERRARRTFSRRKLERLQRDRVYNNITQSAFPRGRKHGEEGGREWGEGPVEIIILQVFMLIPREWRGAYSRKSQSLSAKKDHSITIYYYT